MTDTFGVLDTRSRPKASVTADGIVTLSVGSPLRDARVYDKPARNEILHASPRDSPRVSSLAPQPPRAARGNAGVENKKSPRSGRSPRQSPRAPKAEDAPILV